MRYEVNFSDGSGLTIEDSRTFNVLATALIGAGFVETKLADYQEGGRIVLVATAVKFIRAVDG